MRSASLLISLVVVSINQQQESLIEQLVLVEAETHGGIFLEILSMLIILY